METYLDSFLGYLEREKRVAKNTSEAYKRDILDFSKVLSEKNAGDLLDATNTEVVAYLFKLKGEGKSAATLNRKIASLRAFYTYLTEQKIIKQSPTVNIKSPKVERKDLEYLTVSEVDNLLSVPDGSIRGLRDKAILELLYATGIRVTELIEANIADINMRMGFVTCNGDHGKARIIPMGRPARAAMEEYIFEVRDKLIREGKEETALFVNYNGGRMSRQGLWKILKDYAVKAGIEKLTPQTLRNSFAVHMVQNGADLKSLQELLGHEDISATQVYLSVKKNRIKDVYDKTHPRA